MVGEEVMMWQLLQCGNLDLDTFPHIIQLYSQLYHFYWVKYYVLYIIKKLKLRRIQWYRLARNITALLQCNSRFLCINSSILSITPTKAMSNITYYISIESYKWVESDYVMCAVRFVILLNIIANYFKESIYLVIIFSNSANRTAKTI